MSQFRQNFGNFKKNLESWIFYLIFRKSNTRNFDKSLKSKTLRFRQRLKNFEKCYLDF